MKSTLQQNPKKSYKQKYINGNRLENAKLLYEKASSQSHKIYQYVKDKLTN
uniref:Uncharacterized protein n=1 Tax=Staphylococcus aureus TaxID=1280 RepID=A0A499S167_STAAU|nr:hypothetical protein D0Y80_l00175 [Staphylococcus aureus]